MKKKLIGAKEAIDGGVKKVIISGALGVEPIKCTKWKRNIY